MDISLRIAQLESGQEEHLLLHPEIHMPYITKSWVTDTSNFMEKHNLQKETSNQWLPHTSCQNDEVIMTALIKKGLSNTSNTIYTSARCINNNGYFDSRWNGNQT